MSAGESLPARPRPLARTRPRIPRQPWGGGGCPRAWISGWPRVMRAAWGGLDINQRRDAAWDLHLGDSRGAPTHDPLSIPESVLRGLGRRAARTEGRGSRGREERNHSTQAIFTPELGREGLRNLYVGAHHLRTSKPQIASPQVKRHPSPLSGCAGRAGGLGDERALGTMYCGLPDPDPRPAW